MILGSSKGSVAHVEHSRSLNRFLIYCLSFLLQEKQRKLVGGGGDSLITIMAREMVSSDIFLSERLRKIAA